MQQVPVETLLGVNGRGSGEAALVSVLERIERRLSRLEGAVERAEAATRAVPAMVAAVTDSIDDAARQGQAAGIDVDARLRAALPVLEHLTRPEVLAALTKLTEHIDVVERGLSIAEQAPGLLAMATDTFDGLTRRLGDANVDVDVRVKNLLAAMERLTSDSALEVLHALLDRVDVVHAVLESGVFDPAPVAVVSCAGSALASTGRETPPPVGFWGALRALSDPNIQRALGFALRFAQVFGGSLSESTCETRRAAGAASGSTKGDPK